MAVIHIADLHKRFGHVAALDGVSLEVPDGESLAVLGPSGSGKSTLLRVIAGLESADAGEVYLDGAPQGGLPPHRRPVSIVFQHFALYPHLSALENITLGLVHGLGLSKAEANRRARQVATSLEIEELLDRRPKAMSGGQRQRVALARAMARGAGVVLLDEPMSGLDAQLHLTLRVEIAKVLRTTGATTLHVTHDQLDAMAMADRIAVLRNGRVEQIGTPDDLYERPVTAFVAGFIGAPPMNLLPASHDGDCHRSPFVPLAGLPYRGNVLLGIRPEHLRLGSAPASEGLGADALVVLVEAAGSDRVVHLDVDGAAAAARCPNGTEPAVGARVGVVCDRHHVHVFDASTGQRMGMLADVSSARSTAALAR